MFLVVLGIVIIVGSLSHKYQLTSRYTQWPMWYMDAAPILGCTVPTQCPVSGGYYYCNRDSGAPAANGCQAVTFGPFPEVDCPAAQQCITCDTLFIS